jgi:L-lysine exporter family protein LysE/ArgO
LIAFSTGFLASLSLILAIGAQNAFVLRQGLRREHMGVVIAICAISDALLIVLGILGLGALIISLPILVELFRYGGAAYLVWFGISALRRAQKPDVLEASKQRTSGLGSVVITTLAITYLNPHVYIDTVILLGSIANQFADRWVFAIGAILASTGWFLSLGLGAKLLGKYVSKPWFWRALDLFIALVMFSIAGLLLVFEF